MNETIIYDDYEIIEEKTVDGDDQYRVVCSVEDPSWIGVSTCTVAIVFEKSIAYEKFGKGQ